MNLTITQIPIYGWGTLIFLGVCGLFYLISAIRRNDMEVLRSSNEDLRAAIDDKGKEIQEIKKENEANQIQMQSQITILEEKVAALEKRNKTLEDLVVTALKQYFFENPTVASSIGKAVTK